LRLGMRTVLSGLGLDHHFDLLLLAELFSTALLKL
jgi:hypothetical protein